jgi:hypothetical protein
VPAASPSNRYVTNQVKEVIQSAPPGPQGPGVVCHNMMTKNAFEKWNVVSKETFIRHFCEAFNSSERENFEYRSEGASIGNNFDYDFYVESPSLKKLKVQHTLALDDKALTKHLVSGRTQEKIIALIKNDIADLKDLFVSIGFNSVPTRPQEIEALALRVSTLIRYVNDHPNNFFLFSYRQREDVMIDSIKPWIRKVQIGVIESPKVLFIYSGEAFTQPMKEDIQLSRAVVRKENNYGEPDDLILVVHFNSMPIWDVLIPDMRDGHKNSSFFGIWIYEEWKNKFIKIK